MIISPNPKAHRQCRAVGHDGDEPAAYLVPAAIWQAGRCGWTAVCVPCLRRAAQDAARDRLNILFVPLASDEARCLEANGLVIEPDTGRVPVTRVWAVLTRLGARVTVWRGAHGRIYDISKAAYNRLLTVLQRQGFEFPEVKPHRWTARRVTPR